MQIPFDLIIELGLIIGIFTSAIYVAEARPISRAVGGFILFSVLVAILYLYLGAPYLAGSQIAIYTGAVTGLLLLAMSITKPELPEEKADLKMLLGLLGVGVTAFIVAWVVLYGYPYSPGITSDAITSVLSRVSEVEKGLEIALSNYLWNYRGIDILIQGVLVIGIAAGLSHFFKREVKKE